jgi:hypothetical protein
MVIGRINNFLIVTSFEVSDVKMPPKLIFFPESIKEYHGLPRNVGILN